MYRQRTIITLAVILVILLSACSAVTGATLLQVTPLAATLPVSPTAAVPSGQPPVSSNGAVAALEGTLQQIYERVNPSVVNIQVTTGGFVGAQGQDDGSNPFGLPQGQQPFTSGLGSGFVWDKEGHIVTNNHVVDGASQVDVIFSDGLTVPATVVGSDVNSDLAVIKVDVPADRLAPVTLADSTQVKVGELAVAIGNPFGLQGSMSVGFISGLGRSLPVGGDTLALSGPSYTIPDIIQTDAPINPGNSGGVLVDDEGKVLGVTAAIESPVRASAGVGFVIPSVIVNKVVPALIQDGNYQHTWLGIRGSTMRPEFAEAMNLNSDQRGALVIEVTPDSPAGKAGIRGSQQTVTIDGQEVNVGGDVIVSADGSAVKTFEDLVTFLARNTNVGQKISLGLLRDGKVTTVDVTLEARPETVANVQTEQQAPIPARGAWLGIQGMTLTAELAQAMNLPENQRGVLVAEVQDGSPAQQAGLRGGSRDVTIDGQAVSVGGDVITAIDGQQVRTLIELRATLSQAEPGDTVQLTILRDGNQSQVTVTLDSQPSTAP